MRLPITRFGLPQAAVYPILVFGLMVALFILFRPARFLVPVEIVLFLVFIWMLSFFRDPARNITLDETLLYSPADGTITGIEVVDCDAMGAKALRISIFLSVFNVHINRAPCQVRIESVVYKKGQFKNAMDADSGRVNESNDILMTRLNAPKDRLLVRQISGAIARRIVCEAAENDEYAQGEKFGMIKFGSRTELYIPADGSNDGSYDPSSDSSYEVIAKTGDKVRAGLTTLVRYKK